MCGKLRSLDQMIIHLMRRFNVLEFIKELFCDFIYESKSYNVLNFSWSETMRPKNLIVFLCVTWAVAFTSACCREKQMDSLFTNVKRWCFDSLYCRCGSTPVSTVLRKSVTLFMLNIFLKIKTLSKLKSGHPNWMTRKPRKGDLNE